MTEHLAWYIARSSGIVGWVMLAASVLWGLTLSAKLRPGGVRPAWIVDYHRYLGALASIFTIVHIAGIVADQNTDFGLSSVLVPMASRWRPGAIAWGVVAFYLLAAVEVTSLARRKMPRQLWKAVHLMSLPLFVVSTTHMLLSGSEAKNPILLTAGWAAGLAVVILVIARMIERAGQIRTR